MNISKITIVVPAYNEASTIQMVVDQIKLLYFEGIEKEVIVVDDHSTDQTLEILKKINEPNWKIIEMDVNSGKGAALRAGFKQATGDIVVIQDADMEYDPNEIPRLFEPIKSGFDVVYGSRYLNSDPDLPFLHSRCNKLFTKLSNIFTGQKITDVMTCYKVFTQKSLQAVLPKLESNRFGFEPEVTAKLSRAGFKIIEVPVSYRPRTHRDGKHMNWKGQLESLWAVFKYAIKK